MQNNIMNVKCLHHNTTHNDARLVPCPKTTVADKGNTNI
jgi:hypothetical protein